MRRCVMVLPDAGPINSLWVADRLDLLLAIDMTIVVVDAVYDELTSDATYLKDREVRAFIDSHSPPFIVEPTDIGRAEREKRRLGQKLKGNAGELAMVDFLSSDDGIGRYLGSSDPVAVLFEDAGFRVFNKPPNLHLISTVFPQGAGRRRIARLGRRGTSRDDPPQQAGAAAERGPEAQRHA